MMIPAPVSSRHSQTKRTGRTALCRLPLGLLGGIMLSALAISPQSRAQEATKDESSYAIALHGGAGTITRASMTAESEAAYRAALGEALIAGQSVLKSGGTAIDAVAASIRIMEDSPLFNAGKGAVFTYDGRNELDAAIMDGRTLKAGAVTGVTRIKNPILLARAVMGQSRHVMLSGSGAEHFARIQGIDLVSPTWFFTDRRYQQLLSIQNHEKGAMQLHFDGDHQFGTVGVVALDQAGNLAAGTSTGGLTNKEWGRIGDSPIIGAGTYADNKSCAVSATGTGEYFMRATAARTICALIEYKGYDVQKAADEVIHQKIAGLGGDGGVIALSHSGEIAFSFNTEGMYRAKLSSQNPTPLILIYKD
ncbi:isoaspartyl peptidase [alpha proteobacterium Q-1]|nr:isoaspartyl peptidase/L-asparaginase [Iodidimonas nitroreducens]GAK32534.1 isoaspartyl peptidase [alpha proteobacterium Q-1]